MNVLIVLKNEEKIMSAKVNYFCYQLMDNVFLNSYIDPNEDEELFVNVGKKIIQEPKHINMHSLEGHIRTRTL